MSTEQSIKTDKYHLFLNFDVPEDAFSRRRCVNCCKVKPPAQPGTFKRCSRCKSCVYCSKECQKQDWSIHKRICKCIDHQTNKILNCGMHVEAHFEIMLEVREFDEERYENLHEYGISDKVLVDIGHDYIHERRELIPLLFLEAECRKRTNLLAIDLVILHLQDIFHNDKYDTMGHKEQLMRLLMRLDRFQECYDLCKFFAKNGESYYDKFLDSNFHRQITRPNLVGQDLTEPVGDIDLNHDCFCPSAVTGIYYIKYWLHLNTVKLRWINTNCLDNADDCTAIIADFLGIKREWWQVDEKDWYKDQAEILLNTLVYHDNGAKFLTIISGSPPFAHNELKVATNDALQKARLKGGQKYCPEKIMTVRRHQWEETLARSRFDHAKDARHILDHVDEVIEELNAIAGVNVMDYESAGANVMVYERKPFLFSATKFVVDLMTICHNNFHLFHELPLARDILDCLVRCTTAERKIAQCELHLVKHTKEAKEILSLLPNGSDSIHKIPSVDEFYLFRRGSEEDVFEYFADLFDHIAQWKTEVTAIIDGLYRKNAATERNLRTLFGSAEIVSNRLWHLRRLDENKGQMKIFKFVQRRKR